MSGENVAGPSTSRQYLKNKNEFLDPVLSSCLNTSREQQVPSKVGKQNKFLVSTRKNTNSNFKKISKQPRSKASNVVAEENESIYKKDFLSNLPNEIYNKIFDLLSFDDFFNLECANKRLRNIISNIFWSKIDAFDHETIIKNTKYLNLKDVYYRYVKAIDLHNITIKSIYAVLSRANIKCLDVSMYYRTLDSRVCSLLIKAPQLTTLDLSYIEMKKESLKMIAKFCTLLEKFTLEGCIQSDIAEPYLKDIYIQCKNLKYLNLSYNVCGDSLEYIPSQLLYLNLSKCDISFLEMDILTEKAVNLETLILEGYKDVFNLNIWLNKLKKLRFFEFNDFDPKYYPSINLSHMKDLEMVYFKQNNSFKTQSLQSLQECSKLKSLNLQHIYNANRNWQREFQILKNFKALKYCKFGYIFDFTGFIDFIQTCQIEYLSLNNCDKLNDEIIKAIITQCNSLTHFELHHQYKNYNDPLSNILSQQNPHRQNILKLIIDRKGNHVFPPCEWCEVILCEGTSPFDDFTNVRNQYSKE